MSGGTGKCRKHKGSPNKQSMEHDRDPSKGCGRKRHEDRGQISRLQIKKPRRKDHKYIKDTNNPNNHRAY